MLFFFNSKGMEKCGWYSIPIYYWFDLHRQMLQTDMMKGQDGHPFIISKRETDDWGGAPPFLETSVQIAFGQWHFSS